MECLLDLKIKTFKYKNIILLNICEKFRLNLMVKLKVIKFQEDYGLGNLSLKINEDF